MHRIKFNTFLTLALDGAERFVNLCSSHWCYQGGKLSHIYVLWRQNGRMHWYENLLYKCTCISSRESIMQTVPPLLSWMVTASTTIIQQQTGSNKFKCHDCLTSHLQIWPLCDSDTEMNSQPPKKKKKTNRFKLSEHHKETRLMPETSSWFYICFTISYNLHIHKNQHQTTALGLKSKNFLQELICLHSFGCFYQYVIYFSFPAA
jgi:hypothetical protein